MCCSRLVGQGLSEGGSVAWLLLGWWARHSFCCGIINAMIGIMAFGGGGPQNCLHDSFTL